MHAWFAKTEKEMKLKSKSKSGMCLLNSMGLSLAASSSCPLREEEHTRRLGWRLDLREGRGEAEREREVED